MMVLTYGKLAFIQDLQLLFEKHNVQAISVDGTGNLFTVNKDGSLTVKQGATIKSFKVHPEEKKPAKFKVIDGQAFKKKK
ncbi:hypothetical protein [Thalassobacillus pellis]|uniref:hypothetical protein n=1 Tax=Thalassobacillus pellis TaxID=748008 RepID=UPI001EF8D194|nr:hypothetical protein [Thalassobacillus pellis]MBM7553767.1 hypothetical protein [Thalassobacillus pellis]